MKHIILVLSLCFSIETQAQELYPSSEPASAMSSKSIGIRVANEIFPKYDTPKDEAYTLLNKTIYRLNPELMWGINKKWMVHVNFYASNAHQSNFKYEGNSLYVKYRFLSQDQVQSHFRMALFAKASLIDNAIQYHEINLAGDNSGLGAGIIATQLVHKIAVSFTGGYLRNMNNLRNNVPSSFADYGLNYSLSVGYLFLPFKYTSYNQPNLNLYVEFLGKSNPQTGESFMDIAPAAQLILNSIARIDFVYEKQLYGNTLRTNNTLFLVRFEYNFLNCYK